MFTMVILNSGIHPRRVYLFFLVMTLHDYGHTTSLRNWFTWVRHSVGIHGVAHSARPVAGTPV